MKKLMAVVFACCMSLAVGGAYAMSHAQDEMKKGDMKKDEKKGEMKKDGKERAKDMSKGEMKKDEKKGDMKKDDKY